MGIALLAGNSLALETNLLALGEGALPIVEPPGCGGREPVNIIDHSPGTARASEDGSTGNGASGNT
jgi:hypothetical protein